MFLSVNRDDDDGEDGEILEDGELPESDGDGEAEVQITEEVVDLGSDVPGDVEEVGLSNYQWGRINIIIQN